MKGALERIGEYAHSKNTLLCVGLDPSESSVKKFRERNPHICQGRSDSEVIELFCKFVVDRTRDHVCCFKPNTAFFEAHGPAGFAALKNVCDYIDSLQIPIILDAKRGDIGSTAHAYATAAFGVFKATVVTVNPYLGLDSLTPFLDSHPENGIFVLCRTSNTGSYEIQAKRICLDESKEPIFFYEYIADICQRLPDALKCIGYVIGATQSDAIRRIRSRHPDAWFLVPGVGAQGGDLEEAIVAGLRADGLGIILPVSRAIADTDAPDVTAAEYKLQINKIRNELRTDTT